MFTGGVMHIIDNVLTIPLNPGFTAVDSNLTALAGALTDTNLISTVDGLKDVTIFAPSNEAFRAIGSATGSLTTQQLSSILTYHVINGTVAYSPLIAQGLANTSIPTVNSAEVKLLVEDNKVFVNSAQVVITDIIVANGVMHVLNKYVHVVFFPLLLSSFPPLLPSLPPILLLNREKA
jgi:transforming growth factor-beta-induced protein